MVGSFLQSKETMHHHVQMQAQICLTFSHVSVAFASINLTLPTCAKQVVL